MRKQNKRPKVIPNGHIHQLDQPVPILIQQLYFQESKVLRASNFILDKDQIEGVEHLLYSNLPNSLKRKCFNLLAITGTVQALRAIERFMKIKPYSGLIIWASLALMEVKMAVYSTLTNERQIAITSGLGGKGDLMRFMVVLTSTNFCTLIPYQTHLVQQELTENVKKYEGVVENFQSYDSFMIITLLMPIKSPEMDELPELLKTTRDYCNEFGNFLSPAIYITNSEVVTEAFVRNEYIPRLLHKNL